MMSCGGIIMDGMRVRRAGFAWLPLAQLLFVFTLLVFGAWQLFAVDPLATSKRLVIRSHPMYPYRLRPKPYEFPNGGRTLLPAYRLVALYGVPDDPSLGALGQQPLNATLE